ncbi:transcriptional regulator, AraC family [Leadbetterella byssophila DSM 17132]|uniref:Transcriptional regulator, AraC family n=1 Tax=Leadbetterella byssophila (strain DSM 17132 / JCM 16389 / KACC 11308 / NBRC 106382 / 4M15) TaxID=649349 RepID=E4RX16_LEAB4|nr:helix-turn-helix transcriptional regulator [Leadbetterella byssophila]ADQ18055.1 transcriptional regulator, AraC family [Leadbetterella byssophila DSM 17132]
MLRLPSEISSQPFESLKFRENTFVAFRSNLYPFNNQVFFEENTVIYILEGDKIFRSELTEFKVKKGDILFIRKGYYLYSESTNATYKSLVFFIDSPLIKEFVNQHADLLREGPPRQSPSWVMKLTSDESFGKFVESVLPYFRTDTEYLDHFLRLKAQELLLHLINTDKKGDFRKFLLENFSGKKIDLDYVLNTFYLKNLSLSDLAKISGRSLSSFKREFVAKYGESPASKIRSLRLDHAHFLLKNKLNTVEEVAEAIGYDSVPHFIKSFKEKFGTTPKKI